MILHSHNHSFAIRFKCDKLQVPWHAWVRKRRDI